MKHLLLYICLFLTATTFAQDNEQKKDSLVIGSVVKQENGETMSGVHVLNLNKVQGTTTGPKGEFSLKAHVNDTLYFSYLGYKSIKVRVTNDMIDFPNTKIELTELALALEDVIVNSNNLTGILVVDAKNAPVNDNKRYKINGLPAGYEAGTSTNGVNRVLGAIFNPADFLYNTFGKKPKQMRKLRQMKEDDAIRNMLSTKFDRETLTALLQIDENELEEILSHCNYSQQFIETANDLQILDAISGCYEEYKVLNRNR